METPLDMALGFIGITGIIALIYLVPGEFGASLSRYSKYSKWPAILLGLILYLLWGLELYTMCHGGSGSKEPPHPNNDHRPIQIGIGNTQAVTYEEEQ
jgi:hypothetical protein